MDSTETPFPPPPEPLPSAEPFFADDPTELNIRFGSPTPQSRVTVAFRVFLAIPHFVVLVFLSIIGFLLSLIGWVAALALGRLPRWIASYEMALVAYAVRVNAYVFLLAREFPAFEFSVAEGEFPIRVDLRASRLSRLKVLFRWLLAIPAGFVVNVVQTGLLVLSPIIWIITLVRGQMPNALFGATAAVVRYEARYYAYSLLITDTYPKKLFGDWISSNRTADEQLLELSPGATRMVRVIIALGIVGAIGQGVLQAALDRKDGRVEAAVRRLEASAVEFKRGMLSCKGSDAVVVPCFQRHEREAGMAWNRFAGDLTRISFGSDDAAAAILEYDAHAVANALLGASKADTRARQEVAFRKVLAAFKRFGVDSKLAGI